MNDLRCTTCRREFDSEQLGRVNCCSGCGTRSVPMSIKEDVTVKVNVHELRILGIWAEHYAVDCDLKHQDDPNHQSLKKTVNTIANLLEDQIEKALGERMPLTFTHELQEIPKHFKCGEITHIRDGKEILIDEELS